MGRPQAVFRCDASPAIGAGHVARCLALAEALFDDGWGIDFVVGSETVATIPVLADTKFTVDVISDRANPAAEEPKLLRSRHPHGIDLLVIDHYGRDAAFERECRPWARQVLVLDDATERMHDCDILVDAAAINQASYAGRVPPHALVLTGPAYALLQRAFIARRAAALARRDGKPVRNILLSFGATDPTNVTSAALDALHKTTTDVTIALSSRAPHLDAVRARMTPRTRLAVDADMAELIANADLAIGGAGSSAFERAALGLPSILVTLADNQRGICRLTVEAGAAVDGGICDEEFTPRLRKLVETLLSDGVARGRMAQAASALIDGRGPSRLTVAAAGKTAARDGAFVRLRPAETADEAWLLELQREPQTRRYYRNPAVPDADEHHRWLRRVLDDPNRLLAIVEASGARVGMVRLDRVDDHADPLRYVISIAIGARYCNRGIASAVLSLVRRHKPIAVLDADIVPGNLASIRLFSKAGFQRLDDDLYRRMPS